MKKNLLRLLALAVTTQLMVSCNNQTKEQSAEADKTAADSTAAAPDPTKNWKIGVQTWTFRMFPLEEALKKADSAGIKSVEVFFGQPLFTGQTDKAPASDKFGTSMTAANKEKLKQILQSHGIQIVAMGVIVPKDKAEWIKAFDLAKEFGLSYITCEPIKSQWGMIDSLAGVYGIKIAIHDHPKPNPYWSPDSVLAAVQGHPNIGSCADVGHWARNGLNPVDCLKKLEGHVYGVHLKDITVFGKTDAADTAVSKGVIDFPAIFAELKRQQFSGMFSIEQESNWYHNLVDVKNTVSYFHEQVGKLK